MPDSAVLDYRSDEITDMRQVSTCPDFDDLHLNRISGGIDREPEAADSFAVYADFEEMRGDWNRDSLPSRNGERELPNRFHGRNSPVCSRINDCLLTNLSTQSLERMSIIIIKKHSCCRFQ
jgi:hypothetical protein